MYAITGTAPPDGNRSRPEWDFNCVDDASVQMSFLEASQGASETLLALRLAVGEHMLREDIPDVLSRAAGRELTGSHRAAMLRCYALDASGTIAWPEFQRSWRALQQAGAVQHAEKDAPKGRAKPKHSRGCHPPAPAAGQPATAQQEIGWGHAAAPLQPRRRCEAPGARYLPLSGTDVTSGGQGSSKAAYYGMYL